MDRLRGIAILAAMTGGCAGGTFPLDAPLRARPALEISGNLGMDGPEEDDHLGRPPG